METFPSHNIPHKSTAVLSHLYAIVTQSVIPLQFQRNGRTRPPGYIELGPVGRQSRSPIAPGLLQDEALHHLTNPHAILNPFTIPSQFVNVTAGVYRTRAGPWAVSFTDYVRIAPRLRIVPRFTTDATAAKNRDNGRGIAGQSQNPIQSHQFSTCNLGPIHDNTELLRSTRNGGNSRATPRSFRTPELHRKTCTQSYKSSRNPQSIRNSRHNR